MDFRLSPEELAFRDEVRDFIFANWPIGKRTGHAGDAAADEDYERDHAFLRKLGERGWLAISWPKEYGGAARSAVEQYIFFEEMAYYGVPCSTIGVNNVGKSILHHGAEAQKRYWLPRIASGEADFCLGYTEPSAGSDLASLRTMARRDGDHFVIDGQKVFTSSAHKVAYCWLAARTDPQSTGSKGISVFIVDLKSAGITIRPLWTIGDTRTNITHWDNVRVPADNLVGDLHQGWRYITTALSIERIAAFPAAGVRFELDEIIRFATSCDATGRRPIDNPAVRQSLAALSARMEGAHLLGYWNAYLIDQGTVSRAQASMFKVAVTELFQDVVQAAMEIMGPYGQLQTGSAPGGHPVPGDGRMERVYRASMMPTFGGGTNEIQRDIIARDALEFPRG